MSLRSTLTSWFTPPLSWRLHQWWKLVAQINALEPSLEPLTAAELRKKSLALRYRARSGEPLERLMPEAYALVREAGRRTIKMRHFDVQILGGIAAFYGSIIEMQTGEGKTLTATLPMYLYALAGRGSHLATVNDYLAKRDADQMRPVYEALGLSAGVIQTQDSRDDRRKSYSCDITYGTAKEFGFDFLRDRLRLRRIREGQTDLLGGMIQEQRGSDEKPVQRDAWFALVDEADSILIDEARTPLIISAMPTEEEKQAVACFEWAATQAALFEEDEDYEYDYDKKSVELTKEGRKRVRGLEKPEMLDTVGMFNIYEYIERAIKVSRDYILDRQYVVRDGEIVIVDEFTGRLGEGRKWRDGIHQAVEAKEGVKISVETGQAARVTVQDFFLRYERLAGMTGTVAASAREMKKIYRQNFVPVPTNRPPIREQLSTRIFGSESQKWEAIVEEISELYAQRRPILIGTRSIDKSEILSHLLTAKNIPHQVLNANRVEEEAEIISHAGELGMVTVSTNMAGRGTDIRLGEGVIELGGLHVICTEMHDSARIDRQLIGRCGRQGDPGTYRQYLAMDDELLFIGLGPKKSKKLKAIGEADLDGKVGDSGGFDPYYGKFRRAQKKTERRHFRDRKTMMYYERQRKKQQIAMGQDPYLDSPH